MMNLVNSLVILSDWCIDFVKKIVAPLKVIWGWLTAIFLYVMSLLGEGSNLVKYVAVAVIIDTIFGILVAVKTKKGYFKSHKLRDGVVVKSLGYFFLLAASFLIDKCIGGEGIYVMRVFAIVLCTAEAWSVLGNFAILFPKSPVSKVLQKYLVGEIAKKLEKTEEEVEEMLIEQNKE